MNAIKKEVSKPAQDAEEGLSERVKWLLEAGAEITGAGVGGGLGAFASGPLGGAAGAVIGAVLTRTLNDVARRALAHRESARVGGALRYAQSFIAEWLDEGRRPRTDGFFDQGDTGQSNAGTLLEGVLIKSRDAYEEKKIKHLGYMYAQSVFDNSGVGVEDFVFRLKLVERLTFRQLCLIGLYAWPGFLLAPRETPFWDIVGRNHYLATLSYEYEELYDARLLSRDDGSRTPLPIGRLIPAHFVTSDEGERLTLLLGLHLIPNRDLVELRRAIDLYPDRAIFQQETWKG
jgi:hypothetical protein